jgi:cysteine desulfurase
MTLHYFDHAATTPCLVTEAMAPYWEDCFANAGSLHPLGFKSREAVDLALATLNQAFHAPDGSTWLLTSGATESNHTLLSGLLADPSLPHPHLVLSAFEHDAMAEPARHLCQQHGWQLTALPVEADTGLITPQALADCLAQNPASLVSLIHGHNEVGTLQPVAELARVAHQHGALFHTDAAQTAGKLALFLSGDAPDAWAAVDYLTLSGHKCYGPKGIGALYRHPSAPLPKPLLYGGGQQNGLRGGTEPVPLVVGLATAVTHSLAWYTDHPLDDWVAQLRDAVLAAVPQARWNGPWHPRDRVPGHAHFSFAGLGGDALVNQLGLKGFAVSSGSACHSQKLQPSAAVLALGRSEAASLGTLRITMGRHTTQQAVQALTEAIITVTYRLYQRKPLPASP